MARIKGAVTTRRRRKKILKLAKGYWGARSTHFKIANQAVMKSLRYAYIGRKQRKRDFRRLWITRISAGTRQFGLSYSRFINALKKLELPLNRKVLADMAVNDKEAFAAVVAKAKAVL
jgi:large subunit ribosomal protein L20